MMSLFATCMTFYIMPDYTLCKSKTFTTFSECQKTEHGKVVETTRVYVNPAYYESLKVCEKEAK